MPYRPSHCRHCTKNKVTRPRGLCWSCYYTPGLKDQYPDPFRDGKRYVEATSPGPCPAPARPLPGPTTARPGTPEKIAVLEERMKRGEMLYHPEDAK